MQREGGYSYVITEGGTYEKLIAKNGKFAELVARQRPDNTEETSAAV